MGRRGENIYKRKDGRWEGRYIRERDDAGKARYGYLYAGSYGEVREKMRRVTAKEEERVPESAMTFGALTRQWLQNIRLKVKESSYVKYSNMAANHISPKLGTVRLCRFTTQVMEEFIAGQLESGRKAGNGGLSRKTVRDMITVIKEICTFGNQQGYVIPCCLELIHIKHDILEVQVLTEEEQGMLGNYLQSRQNPICTGILLSLYMGLRIGEVCALKWENIRLEEQTIEIRSTMQRIQDLSGEEEKRTKIIVTEPKSLSSRRDIPIPDFLYERLRAEQEGEPDTYYLTGRRQACVEPRSMENYFKKILKACGIEQVNYHVLRHTFATRCIENGFDVKSLSEVLGHANVNITLNRYVHSSMEQKRKNMRKVTLQSP